MAKSKILQQIANKEITVEVAFRRLYIIANDLQDDDLITWIDKELYGYSPDDAVPEYRNIGCGAIVYSGIKGTMMCNMQIKNAPFPFQYIPKQFQSMLVNNYRRDSIATLEAEAGENQSFQNDLSSIIPYLDVGMAITSVYRQYSSNVFAEIINKVSAILLKVFIKLDKSFGNLDELDIGNVDKGVEKELKMFIQKVVFTDNSIHVGNGNKIEKSEIGG